MFKRVLIVMVLLGLVVGSAFAEETSTANNIHTPTLSKKTSADVADHTHTFTDTDTDTTIEKSEKSNDFDMKVGYEKALVKFTNHIILVAEVGINPINFDINDEDVYVELKITDAKPFWDVSKDKEE